MKKWNILILILLALPICYAQICEDRLDNGSSCIMLTPSLTCANYTYSIVTETGKMVLENKSLTLLNNSIYYLNFNLTVGNYIVELCSGQTREIIVNQTYDAKFQEEVNSRMYIGIVLGIGIVAALFLWLAFKIDESHGLLKLLFIFTSITLLATIPATFIVAENYNTFHKAMMVFLVIFWLYVGGYFIYWLFQKFKRTVPR